MAPAMDQQIIWDVFAFVVEAARELKISDEFTGIDRLHALNACIARSK